MKFGCTPALFGLFFHYSTTLSSSVWIISESMMAHYGYLNEESTVTVYSVDLKKMNSLNYIGIFRENLENFIFESEHKMRW